MGESIKGLLQSKTFWGIVVVLLIPLLKRVGVDLNDATGTEIAGDMVQLVGAVLAIYGRVVASKTVDTSSVKTLLIGGSGEKAK